MIHPLRALETSAFTPGRNALSFLFKYEWDKRLSVSLYSLQKTNNWKEIDGPDLSIVQGVLAQWVGDKF